MSKLKQQDEKTAPTTTTTIINTDGCSNNLKSGSDSTLAILPQQSLTTLADQMLVNNYNLKWDKATLEQKMAALKLETQKQFFETLLHQKDQMEKVQLTLRALQTASHQNQLYKTALCNFWSAGVPCRFGERCWFAHGLNELRIARFVDSSLHPYDYEIRMNPANKPTHKPNSKSSRTTVCLSGGNSGIRKAATSKSARVNAGHRENLNAATYQFSSLYDTPLTSYSKFLPSNFLRPLDVLINQEPKDFSRNEAYNH